MSKNILVTRSAGFLGFHLCKKILASKNNVIEDVQNTKADHKLLKSWIGDYSRTPTREVIRNFVSFLKKSYIYEVI
tara:strand:- start:633 stop:860 length:228 start_codon:yes stop_codon:yes gene_type:complete